MVGEHRYDGADVRYAQPERVEVRRRWPDPKRVLRVQRLDDADDLRRIGKTRRRVRVAGRRWWRRISLGQDTLAGVEAFAYIE
ncbi:MAG TPA: hypothetical protein VN719_05695, partial [Gemmatimonadales bacterium]|nr:hypothetical protein [Gemmatimonadales bacterium]